MAVWISGRWRAVVVYWERSRCQVGRAAAAVLWEVTLVESWDRVICGSVSYDPAGAEKSWGSPREGLECS